MWQVQTKNSSLFFQILWDGCGYKINKLSFAFAALVAMTGCNSGDPIDRLVNRVGSDSTFGNGMYLPIPLPNTTSPENVAAAALGYSLTNLVIIEVKPVDISYGDQRRLAPETTKYIGVLVRTKVGDKIVFLQYQPNPLEGGWWSRAYDAQSGDICK